MKFPLYRKYPNNKNYFKIVSPEQFEEISFIGTRAILRVSKAKTLPDRNMIMDMINIESNWVEISEKEYNKMRSTACF